MRTKTIFTESRIQRLLKEGRGRGSGASYIPWLRKDEISAAGTSLCLLRGTRTQRAHHLVGHLEVRVLEGIEYSDAPVTDIRERYPLDRDTTLKIAQEAGIKHPVDETSGVNLVLWSDLLVDFDDGRQIAFAVETSRKLTKERLDHCEIQRRYWQSLAVPWHLLTEQSLDADHQHNASYGRGAIEMAGYSRIPPEQMRTTLDDILAAVATGGEWSVGEVLGTISTNRELPTGLALFAFRHLVGTRRIVCAQGVRVGFETLISQLIVRDA